ncbi:MAG TPA: GNAT family N-acetyltransferase [Azospirillum sp.]|nr:GNAT family N-acetyltransferase [Azospirillum sp.]
MSAPLAVKRRLPRHGEVRRYTRADCVQLEAFQRECFGDGARQLDADCFEWMYEQNPFHGEDGPQFWVFRHGDTIAGQQGGIPIVLKVGDRCLEASWAVDLMVAPEWRLRGVGPALSEMQADASQVALALGMSDAAYRSYCTAGWFDLGSVPTYLRVIDAASCVRLGKHSAPLLRVAASVADLPLRAFDMVCAGMARLTGTRLVPIPAFDDRVDALWLSASRFYPVVAGRDRRRLGWWFDTGPKAQRYRRFYLTRNGAVKGYIVLRADVWEGKPLGVVIDYFAAPGWLPLLFAHTIAFARNERMIAVTCRTLNRRAHNGLRALGFLTLENGYQTPTRMMLRTNGTAAELAPLLQDRNNWMVTTGDSDTGLRELGP